nr:hypothetical protein [Pirellula staleyi]
MEPLELEKVIAFVADRIARKIAYKVMLDLRKMPCTMSGDDSGLSNVWEEICVQVQYEESHCWDIYEQMIRDLVESYVDELPIELYNAVWLQTDPGFDWLYASPETRNPSPAESTSASKWVYDFVISRADSWSNKAVRRYLRRASERD